MIGYIWDNFWLYVNSVDCAMQYVLTNVLTSQLSREILAVHVVQQLGHLLHVEDVEVVEGFIHQLAFSRDKQVFLHAF